MFDVYTGGYSHVDFDTRFKGKTYSVDGIIQATQQAMHDIDIETLFIQSPMLVKALIDHGIATGEPLGKLKEDISDAVQSLFNAEYEGVTAALERIPNNIRQQKVTDTTSGISWYGTAPQLLDTMIGEMWDQEWNPDTIVMLAHGAYRAAYMVGSVTGSKVIPVRLSTYKKDDKEPHLLHGEEIEPHINGRDVLVFDEDTFEAKGINIIRDYLEQFSPKMVKTGAPFVGKKDSVDFCDKNADYYVNGHLVQ
jgi:hypothetical protein